jgi:hypothetical protein
VYYRKTAFCCAFFVAKGLNAKDIHKEMFPVYGGKCSSCKAVQNWVDKCSDGSYKIADDAQPGRCVEISTDASGSVYAAGVDALAKPWDKFIDVGGGYV